MAHAQAQLISARLRLITDLLTPDR